MRIPHALLLASLVAALWAAPAAAEPPPNDTPATPGVFEPYTTENGSPDELQAIAELAEAGPEGRVPRCLGPDSFERTVWYRVPASVTPREIDIEASGRTLEVVDLAAFVQPPFEGPPVTSLPNSCAGRGAGGSDVAADRASALTLRVPANRAVFVQVGRRGSAGSPDDERAILSYSETPFEVLATPGGDQADGATPRLGRRSRQARVSLDGATTTEDDPAAPSCPSLGGVWRRARVPRTGAWTVTVAGSQASALTVFAGTRPHTRGFRGCVDRAGPGSLVLPLRARRRQTLWIRVGTDRTPPGAQAQILFDRSTPRDEESGGGCLASENPRISGRLASGSSMRKVLNRSRSIALSVNVTRGPVCAATLELVGPKRRVYATGTAAKLRGRGQSVYLRRTRRLVRGRYRLRVEASGLAGVRGHVRSTLAFGVR